MLEHSFGKARVRWSAWSSNDETRRDLAIGPWECTLNDCNTGRKQNLTLHNEPSARKRSLPELRSLVTLEGFAKLNQPSFSIWRFRALLLLASPPRLANWLWRNHSDFARNRCLHCQQITERMVVHHLPWSLRRCSLFYLFLACLAVHSSLGHQTWRCNKAGRH